VSSSIAKGLFPLEHFAVRKDTRFSQAMDIVAARSIGLKPSSMSLPVKITTAEDSVAVKQNALVETGL
jgi:hypothetical protein